MKSSVLKTCLTAALLFRRPDRRGRGLHFERRIGQQLFRYAKPPATEAFRRGQHPHAQRQPAVTPAVAASEPVAEQPNEQVAEQNKQIEERNKKIEEQNRQNKLENCKIAKINRQVAESARLANRDSLIKQYQNDVNKYRN